MWLRSTWNPPGSRPPPQQAPPFPPPRVPPSLDSIYLGEESEDEDEITDYLVAEEEADSAQSAGPPHLPEQVRLRLRQECSPSPGARLSLSGRVGRGHDR